MNLKNYLRVGAFAHIIVIVLNGVILMDILLLSLQIYMEDFLDYHTWVVLPCAIMALMLAPLHIEIIKIKQKKLQGRVYGNSLFRYLFIIAYVVVIFIDTSARFYFISTSILFIWPTTGFLKDIGKMRKTHGLNDKERKLLKKLINLAYGLNIIAFIITVANLFRDRIYYDFSVWLDLPANYCAFLVLIMIICAIDAYGLWLYSRCNLVFSTKARTSI